MSERYEVRRDPDPEPTGEPRDSEAWMVWDTKTDTAESDWFTVDDATDEATRLNRRGQVVTKRDIDGMLSTPLGCNWPRYQKKRLTQALRMDGPFTVQTREGELTCPDGYLALDSQGWPYPIAKDEFDVIYGPAPPPPEEPAP